MECDICQNPMVKITKEDGEKFWLCDKCDYEIVDFGRGLPEDEAESESPPAN